MKKNLTGFLISAFSILLIINLISALNPVTPVNPSCSIKLKTDCTDLNTIIKLSSATNAHGAIYSYTNYNYALCCNFNAGTSSQHTCEEDKSNTIMYLQSETNSHAEQPIYLSVCIINSKKAFSLTCHDFQNQSDCLVYGCTWSKGFLGIGAGCSGIKKECNLETDADICSRRGDCIVSFTPDNSYTMPICFGKGMKCRGINNLSLTKCSDDLFEGSVFNVEVASLSSETNAHIGNFSDYPIKICCSEMCEMFTTNNDCWEKPNMKCTWWPPGTTTSGDGGGCCDEGRKWNGIECRGTTGLCSLIWMVNRQIPDQSVFGTPYWKEYCADLNPELSYGERQYVQTY